MSTRLALPKRREHTTQKVRIGGQRTLYISGHNDDCPAETFLRLNGLDCSSELIGLYDVVARLMSIALQYGASLEKVGDFLAGAKFAPFGPVSGHDRIKCCSSLPDQISGRRVAPKGSCHRAGSRLYRCVCTCRDHQSGVWRELPGTGDRCELFGTAVL